MPICGFASLGFADEPEELRLVAQVYAKDHTAKSDNVTLTPQESQSGRLAVCSEKDGFQEWEVQLDQGDIYYINFLYASGESRPVQLMINGEVVDESEHPREFLASNTGGYDIPDLRWETCGPFELPSDTIKIRIDSKGQGMPNIAGFAVSRYRGMWTCKTDWVHDALPEFFPQGVDPCGPIETDTAKTRAKLRDMMSSEAGSPNVDELMFVKRQTFQSSHYYTDFIDGCVNFGSNICILSLIDGSVRELLTGPMTEGIVGRCDISYDGHKVVFGWKEKIGVGFRIYEVGIDGTGLRQLTFPPADEEERIAKYRLPWWETYWHHTDDMHPCYLPDGGICFVSTRCEYGILCDRPDKLTTSVLSRMDADGENMEKLSNNSVSESAPTVMNDGRILYTRWEYVDNGSVTNKGLWTIRPDGTGTEEVHGMDIALPSVFNVGRAVPGGNNLFVTIGAPHMPLGVGTVLLIDTQSDRRQTDGITYITPEVDAQHQTWWDNIPGGVLYPVPPEHQFGREHAGNTTQGPLYMDPYPLDRSNFIVSMNPREEWNATTAYDLYLINDRGEISLLHEEAESSCWMPLPVRSRRQQTIPRGLIEPELEEMGLARLIVTDIYRGLDDVPRGTIKYIRINEHVSRPWAARRFWSGDDFDQQHSVITNKSHLGLRVQCGIVPVEEDGSAHFLVEADKNIFFQALDENYMEVQRERTFVNFRPGEVRACIGCHEHAQDLGGAMPTTGLPLAMRYDANIPGPQPGEETGARPISYAVDVQPVWDAHCISCHRPENTETDLDLSGELTTFFNVSYENLTNRRMLPMIRENHPKVGNNHYLPPYSLGTHASLLKGCITKEHYGVELSPEEQIRVTTWIDSNGQYHGSYYGRKNLMYSDHPNFRPVLTYEQSHANTPPIPEEAR